MSRSPELEKAGYDLAEEIRDGKWDHIGDLRWNAAAPEIVDELQRRIPGFTTAEYEHAVTQGLFDSR